VCPGCFVNPAPGESRKNKQPSGGEGGCGGVQKPTNPHFTSWHGLCQSTTIINGRNHTWLVGSRGWTLKLPEVKGAWYWGSLHKAVIPKQQHLYLPGRGWVHCQPGSCRSFPKKNAPTTTTTSGGPLEIQRGSRIKKGFVSGGPWQEVQCDMEAIQNQKVENFENTTTAAVKENGLEKFWNGGKNNKGAQDWGRGVCSAGLVHPTMKGSQKTKVGKGVPKRVLPSVAGARLGLGTPARCPHREPCNVTHGWDGFFPKPQGTKRGDKKHYRT